MMNPMGNVVLAILHQNYITSYLNVTHCSMWDMRKSKEDVALREDKALTSLSFSFCSLRFRQRCGSKLSAIAILLLLSCANADGNHEKLKGEKALRVGAIVEYEVVPTARR